jgi:hypothetical protein
MPSLYALLVLGPLLLLLVQPILLILKLDGVCDWSWKVTLIPCWLLSSFAALVCVVLCVSLIDIVILSSRKHYVPFDVKCTLEALQAFPSACLFFLCAPACMAALLLDGDASFNWALIFLPSWLVYPLIWPMSLLTRSSDRLPICGILTLWSVLPLSQTILWAVR